MKRKRPNTKDRFRAGRRVAEREAERRRTGQQLLPGFDNSGFGFDRPTPERTAWERYVPAFNTGPRESVRKGGRHVR